MALNNAGVGSALLGLQVGSCCGLVFCGRLWPSQWLTLVSGCLDDDLPGRQRTQLARPVGRGDLIGACARSPINVLSAVPAVWCRPHK